jgi:putative endopeptidase
MGHDAYNGGLENKIVVATGHLQPPFFNPDADPSVNYGAIGAIIGHEITHGFDDQGRKIDASGKLPDWWTAEDAKRFAA